MGNFPIMSAALRAELNKRRQHVETDEMTAAEAKLRGAASKDADEDDDVDERKRMLDSEHEPRTGPGGMKRAIKASFADVVFGDNHAVRSFDIDEDHPERPTAADIDLGSDRLGRSYSDEVYDTLGGLNSKGQPDTSPVPRAGSGEPFVGTTQDIQYRPQAFTQGDGTVGGEKRRAPFAPNLGKGPGSYDIVEDVVPEGGAMVSVKLPGGMRIMSPQASGIAGPSAFRAPQPTTVLKSERKVGLFKSAVLGKHGDMADSFLSEE